MKHKHEELIKKWADGARIERLIAGGWHEEKSPQWHESCDYRLMEEKPDFGITATLVFDEVNKIAKFSPFGTHNVDMIFDGMTNKIKEVKLL